MRDLTKFPISMKCSLGRNAHNLMTIRVPSLVDLSTDAA